MHAPDRTRKPALLRAPLCPLPLRAGSSRRAGAGSLDLLGTESRFERHFFNDGPKQFAYVDDLARRAGCPPMPPSFRARYEATGAARRTDPDGYRDAAALVRGSERPGGVV